MSSLRPSSTCKAPRLSASGDLWQARTYNQQWAGPAVQLSLAAPAMNRRLLRPYGEGPGHCTAEPELAFPANGHKFIHWKCSDSPDLLAVGEIMPSMQTGCNLFLVRAHRQRPLEGEEHHGIDSPYVASCQTGTTTILCTPTRAAYLSVMMSANEQIERRGPSHAPKIDQPIE
ncbi:hypothetical protein SCAR479_06464 [Seiridium cardinale]|uniref:Uncharacterized protein n=1 Tax=Seiridium cardinale TaxID=138064 RepID=A0ABR2XSZ6_9PEZI